MTPSSPLHSFRCSHRQALQAAAACSLVLGGAGWLSGHAWSGAVLIAGLGMAWFWASLATRRVDLGEKQGVVWTGWNSVCINRGQNPFTPGALWTVQDVLTGKSQQVDTGWLSAVQAAELAAWGQRRP